MPRGTVVYRTLTCVSTVKSLCVYNPHVSLYELDQALQPFTLICICQLYDAL